MASLCCRSRGAVAASQVGQFRAASLHSAPPNSPLCLHFLTYRLSDSAVELLPPRTNLAIFWTVPARLKPTVFRVSGLGHSFDHAVLHVSSFVTSAVELLPLRLKLASFWTMPARLGFSDYLGLRPWSLL